MLLNVYKITGSMRYHVAFPIAGTFDDHSTESENLEELDCFVNALLAIRQETKLHKKCEPIMVY